MRFIWHWTNADGTKGAVFGDGDHQQDAFARLSREEREKATHAESCERVLTFEHDFTTCVEAMHRGERVEIDAEMWNYWLGVLPPRYMGRVVTLPGDGKKVTAFGFAEGCEPVTAFWRQGNGVVRYFCQRTAEVFV